jgi:hypothetical protein
MPWLDNLFGDSLETQVAKEIADYKNAINEMIAREDTLLRSLGIKPPRLVSEMDYKINVYKQIEGKRVYVSLIPPQFEIPPHRIFVINKYHDLVVTFFENLERIDSVYWWWGLGDVVKTEYGGIWTNRDPYAVYREPKYKDDKGSIFCRDPGNFTSTMKVESIHNKYRNVHDKDEDLPPLRSVSALSSEEASNVHLRVHLYNYVTDYRNRLERATYYDYLRNEWGAGLIPEDIMFKLPVPCTSSSTVSYSCLKIVPSGEIKPAQMIEFLNSLHDINHFFSFELMRLGEIVYFRLQLPTASKKQVVSNLNLYFPDFEPQDDQLCFPVLHYFIKWVEKPRMYNSINLLRNLQIDPYAHFASFFDGTAPGELLCYQILFAPLLDESAATLKVCERNNHPLLESDQVKQFTNKLPLWFVSISVNGTGEQTVSRTIQTATKSFGSPDQIFSEPYSHSCSNSSFPMSYPAFVSMFDTEELASLAHFPITELPIERLEKVSMKNVQPPELYKTGDVLIGESRSRGQMFPVTLPESVRDRHVYLVGKSGTGKSTLIEAIARNDIAAGGGVAVIDPHGDLINHLLETMPEHRVSDCVLFSPKHFPVSLDILTADNEHEIDLLSDDLITMFRRTSESWGDKMQAILQMAFQTLLRVPGSSFTDITRLLTDENFRRQILSKINHPQLAGFWEQRYDVRQAEPILIRMDRLTTSGTLRSVLTQNKNSLNFYDVITESKIFLADLSKGYLGESTSHLLGSIIVSQIQLAAMRQAHLPAEQRIPFSLFVDEVQNFTTSAFSTILSEARKQKLRLTIAHQFVSQLPGDLQKAVFGNVGTLIFFALSPDDLGAARHELGTFEPADVANLPKYHALCRPATSARETFSFATAAPPPLPARNYTETIIEQTRQKYAAQTTSKAEPQVTSAPVAVPPPTTPAVTDSPQKLDMRRPAPARPRQFPINTEKIMHFVRLAEYLSQPQIIAITGLQASNASTALKRLVDTDQLKSLDERRPKIYFIGRSCNATVHNLLVRDLVVKIFASNYAIRALKFNDQLTDLNPDLTIEFLAEDGAPLLAYFELDRGTEGVGELVKKAERYARLTNNPRVCFVFERETDMLLARKTIEYPFINYALLDQFTTLNDHAFSASASASADNVQLPFFR